MIVLSTNAIGNEPTGLSLGAGGVVTVSLKEDASPAPQVGQTVRIVYSTDVPITGLMTWMSSSSVTAGDFYEDANGNTQMAINSGTTGGFAPNWQADPGDVTADNTQNWLCVLRGISWDYDGCFHITSVTSASEFTCLASSQYLFFNPGGTAPGGSISGTGEPVAYAIIGIDDDRIAEVHTVAPYTGDSASGLFYVPSVAFQKGALYVNLGEESAILSAIWTNQNSPLQLANPQLSKVFVRLMDTQTVLGFNANRGALAEGYSPIAAVTGPQSFILDVPADQAVYLTNDGGGGGICLILQSLSMQIPASFVDTSDTQCAAGPPNNCGDDLLLGLQYTDKAGCLRYEVFDAGYWVDGGQVPFPTSDVDAYEYAEGEVEFSSSFSAMNPVDCNNNEVFGPFTPGTRKMPNLKPQSSGTLIMTPRENFIDAEGNVTLNIYTDKGTSVQGITRVTAHCTRQNTALPLPVQQLVLPAP